VDITGADGATIEGLPLEGGRLGNAHGILLDRPDCGKQEDAFRIERCQVARFRGDGPRRACSGTRPTVCGARRRPGRARSWTPRLVKHHTCEAWLRKLTADTGGHRDGVIVKDNPGSVFQPA
jgi:hypothetical protein